MKCSPIQRHPVVARLLIALGVWIAFFALPEAMAEAENPDSKLPGSIEFVAKNLFSTANGTFHEWRVVESSIDSDSLETSHAIIEVTLASVDTGIRRRDKHLLTADFFETETHPVATVRAHSLVAAGENESGHRLFKARFDVDLHGVRKVLEGELELLSIAPILVDGHFLIDRMDFGVGAKPSHWNPMSIDVEIPVHFRIEF